jgi:hypothetical protein
MIFKETKLIPCQFCKTDDLPRIWATSILIKDVNCVIICEKCLWEKILGKRLEVKPEAYEDFKNWSNKPWWKFW